MCLNVNIHFSRKNYGLLINLEFLLLFPSLTFLSFPYEAHTMSAKIFSNWGIKHTINHQSRPVPQYPSSLNACVLNADSHLLLRDNKALCSAMQPMRDNRSCNVLSSSGIMKANFKLQQTVSQQPKCFARSL